MRIDNMICCDKCKEKVAGFPLKFHAFLGREKLATLTHKTELLDLCTSCCSLLELELTKTIDKFIPKHE